MIGIFTVKYCKSKKFKIVMVILYHVIILEMVTRAHTIAITANYKKGHLRTYLDFFNIIEYNSNYTINTKWEVTIIIN